MTEEGETQVQHVAPSRSGKGRVYKPVDEVEALARGRIRA